MSEDERGPRAHGGPAHTFSSEIGALHEHEGPAGPRAHGPGNHTFSSEIGAMHEGPGPGPGSGGGRGRGPAFRTFDDVFEGAPPSRLGDDDQPSMIMSRSEGRFWRWVGIPLIVGALVGAGVAMWQFRGFLFGIDTGEAEVVAEAETEAEAGAAQEGEAQEGEAPEPEPEPTPEPEPKPEPTPTTAGESPIPAEPEPTMAFTAKVETLSTAVRGKVSSGTIEAKLRPVDQALETCWADAVAKGQRETVELELRFTIKWNRRAQGIAVSGEGASKAVRDCAKGAVPRAGWPEPKDLGNAAVTRRWQLRAEPSG